MVGMVFRYEGGERKGKTLRWPEKGRRGEAGRRKI
jgi:hypothetical protein